MYYEGRVTTVFDIEKKEIASILGGTNIELKHPKRKDGTPYKAFLYSEVLFRFKHNHKLYGFANDASSCNGITELAILDMDSMTQIESLTIDWVKNGKLKSILKCCEEPYSQNPTGLTIGEDNKIIGQPKSYFTCGCCGTDFKSTHKEQAIHDQDMGYGICDECK